MKIILCLMSVVLGACSMQRVSPIYTVPTVAKITHATDAEKYTVKEMRTMIINHSRIDYEVSRTTSFFIYAIKTEGGQDLMLRSDREHSVNDCVTLWHSPWSSFVNEDYSYVQGDLVSHNDCSNIPD